jgi:SAM-dependent methyltransferase
MRLNSLGAKVIGADLSEKSIEIAKQRNPEIEFYVKDMLKSYADLGMFDGLACIAGLVHLPEDKMELAFKNMYEVLKDNSYLFIVVRNGDKITKSVEVEGIEYAREFYCYTLDKIKQHSEKYFKFVKELEENGDWRYYILKKK